jgi:3',5'-cyclic AMP phosphodiesterase CpdA
MPLILHLSDLHLGDQAFDDYKSECVPLEERNNKIHLLQNTLEEVGNQLREDNSRLDAVVVSGDITVANNEAGFEQLSSLLSKLGSSLPEPDRVLVTPGNHDVTWRTKPSTSERYENFSRYIRAKGYVTPLLDGLDIDSNGELINAANPVLLSPDLDWMIVAINSSNYSGSLEPLTDIPDNIWNQIPDLLASRGLDRAVVGRVLDRLRLRDVARVSPQQLAALRRILRQVDSEIEAAGKDPTQTLKMAVLHHHLLPVSSAEEFKAFESITNLGQVHQFLRGNEFDIVLHGHKHIGSIYRNHIYDDNSQRANCAQTLLVISGSTIGGQDYREAEVARLIDVQARPYSPRLRIRQLPALRAGSHFPPSDWESHRLWPRQISCRFSASNEVIEGKACSEVYACVLALFEDLPVNQELHNIVCVVHEPSTAFSLPDSYPTVSGVAADQRERWFNELVEWWQREQSSLTKPVFFTHGSRIYKFGGDCNQFGRAVELLRRKPDTSRSIIILVDPRSDNLDDKRKFPSFSLIQMVIRRGGPERFELDCIGYFRKQEMRYWWPVNIAELATIQRRAYGQLAGDVRGLTLGTLTTIAAISYAGTTPPKVAIPALDREFDDHPERLWSMAYALFWPEMPGRSDIGKAWKHFLEDLIPPEAPDPDGVPMSVDGLRFLADQVTRFAVHHAESPASALTRHLNELHRLNERQSDESDPTISHARWRASVKADVETIKKIVDELFR